MASAICGSSLRMSSNEYMHQSSFFVYGVLTAPAPSLPALYAKEAQRIS